MKLPNKNIHSDLKRAAFKAGDVQRSVVNVMTNQKRLYEVPDDFEARIRILRHDEGGRSKPPYNGIRWDFAYDGDDIEKTGIYMIWPDFIDDNGDSISSEKPLPVDHNLLARMTIVSDEMREEIHKDRITEGIRFYCHEGGKRVAVGHVTKITGLYVPRQYRK